MNRNVQQVMQKEMSRKEFLTTFGFGVASLFGLGTLLRLMGHHPVSQQHANNSSMGYGSSVYGGKR